MRIEWHPGALSEFAKLDKTIQKRIKAVLENAESLPTRLKPYRSDLAGLYKLRVGDFRLVTYVALEPQRLVVLLVAHRSTAYGRRSIASLERRRTD